MTEKEVQKFVEFCSTEFGRELMKKEAELVSEKLSAHEKTVSIGCGIGSIGERIEDLDIVYLDSSRPMLLEAKKGWMRVPYYRPMRKRCLFKKLPSTALIPSQL